MSQEVVNSDPLLNTDQASAYICRTKQSLNNDRNLNRGVDYVKIGKLVRYRKSVLDQYIEERTVKVG